MAVQNFVLDLIEKILEDEELALTEQDIRFYDKGTTAETDETLDNHIRWKNARYFNEDSNVIRSSILIIQLPFENGTEYVNFHVGELYRIYRKDGMQGTWPVVKKDIKDAKVMAAQNLVLVNKFRDYEAIREHLIIRPLNYDDNDKVLATGIFRRIGDMALVLYVSLGQTVLGAEGNGRNIVSTMVRRDMFEVWNQDEQEVFDWALENTMRLQPPVFCYVDSYFGTKPKTRHVRFMEDESVQIDLDAPFAPALSTEQEVNGAVAAFFPGVLDRLCRMVGGDFYLVFTGIYDVHIHPANGRFSVSRMRSRLADMNRSANKRGEVLSRQIYRYDSEKKEIILVK